MFQKFSNITLQSTFRTTRRILSSPQFLILSLLLIMFGFFASYIFRFATSIDNQDQILTEIKATQFKIGSLENEVVQLRNANQKLTRTVCLLQKQVESLGAIPVESLEDCNISSY